MLIRCCLEASLNFLLRFKKPFSLPRMSEETFLSSQDESRNLSLFPKMSQETFLSSQDESRNLSSLDESISFSLPRMSEETFSRCSLSLIQPKIVFWRIGPPGIRPVLQLTNLLLDCAKSCMHGKKRKRLKLVNNPSIMSFQFISHTILFLEEFLFLLMILETQLAHWNLIELSGNHLECWDLAFSWNIPRLFNRDIKWWASYLCRFKTW